MPCLRSVRRQVYSSSKYMITRAAYAGRWCVFALALLAGCVCSRAGTWYVDSGAAGANNGTSWSNAWTGLSLVSGVSAGDTVYISGGSNGLTRSYALNSTWAPQQGNPNAVITYQIGQDPAHNGTAIFNGGGMSPWLGSVSYVTVLGDAGDGQRHFAVSNYVQPINMSAFQNVRIGYVNFGQTAEGCDFPFGSQGAFEFDHCYLYKVPSATDANADHAFLMGYANGTNYDVVKIHDNTIFIPQPSNTGSYGDDGFDVDGGGISVYNNTVTGYVTNSSLFAAGEATAHEDCLQSLSASYMKVYGNTFLNGANTGVFLDGYDGNFAHVRVFNNVIYAAVPMLGNPRGLDAGTDTSPAVTNITFSDVVVANNLFGNYGYVNGQWMAFVGMRFGDFGAIAGTYEGSVLVANNLGVNAAFSIQAPVLATDNVNINGANASNFVAYVQLPATAPTNNFHLLDTAGGIIKQGLNLSAFFTTDKDGVARPQSGPWDIGPYQYVSGAPGAPVPTVSGIAQTPGDVDPFVTGMQVYAGTKVRYAGMASDPTGLTVTWQWLYSSNGGPQIVLQSGSGNSPSTSYSYPGNSVGSVYTWTLLVNNGYNTAHVQENVTVEAAPPAGLGLPLAAPMGMVTAPFVATNGYVFQPSAAGGVQSGGRAAYDFNVSSGGSYAIEAMVNAPVTGTNSFWVNVDAEPLDPVMVWNVEPTAGFEQRWVTWHNGTSEASYLHAPQVFALAAGYHTLVIRGRDPGAKLRSLSIVKVPPGYGKLPTY
jgi:hypothetical protein